MLWRKKRSSSEEHEYGDTTDEDAQYSEDHPKKGVIRRGSGAVLGVYNPVGIFKKGYNSAVNKTLKPSLYATRIPFAIMKYGIIPAVLSIRPHKVINAWKNKRQIHVSWHLLSIYSSMFILVSALGLYDHYLWIMDLPILALIMFAIYGNHEGHE